MSLKSESIVATSKGLTFPTLMESAVNGTIILITGAGCDGKLTGFVVDARGLDELGSFSGTWVERNLKPFKGSVILTDD